MIRVLQRLAILWALFIAVALGWNFVNIAMSARDAPKTVSIAPMAPYHSSAPAHEGSIDPSLQGLLRTPSPPESAYQVAGHADWTGILLFMFGPLILVQAMAWVFKKP